MSLTCLAGKLFICSHSFNALISLYIPDRHLFLRALPGKSPYFIAQELLDIYTTVGPPVTIQTDQGTEFRGVVEMLASSMNIRVIRSRPYHPQSQGQVGAFVERDITDSIFVYLCER